MRDVTGLLTPPAFWLPEQYVESAWVEHAPFAFWVMDAHRPDVLVELGTHHGFSYLAFCQAVERLGLDTRCYAVDTWKGDQHTGLYGEEVFEKLSRLHDARYRSFSELQRTTFADAARHFGDHTVDLLHIDGSHRIEDVTSDYETWLPKMSPRGVILFHDINVHRDEFGVWNLWDRIKGNYPHFTFDHGHGLGVLGVGPEAVHTVGGLFELENETQGALVRQAFARLGRGVTDAAEVSRTAGMDRQLEAARNTAAELRESNNAVHAALDHVRRDLATELRTNRVLSQERDELDEAVHRSRAEIEALRSSTSWRITAPLRAMSRGIRPVRRFIRRGVKVIWWMVTLQLPRRIRAYRAGLVPVDPGRLAATMDSERQRFAAPGPLFEDFAPVPQTREARAKLIAMYLPQFHAIPENDEWWGKGFTEWTNLSRGTPRFVGHYQPRIPRDLGYYDLSKPGVMARQAEMAKAAGITAFCFYYYRFPEGRLLEKPVDAFLGDPSIDMPFCILWANENWTRTWDGYDTDVLRRHEYNSEIEDALLADFARHFADPRYIRIAGRPLLLIYRPHNIPDAAETFARWRQRLAASGEDPIILMAQSFDDHDPRPYGLDGAIEFPPHKYGHLPEIKGSLQIVDSEFKGSVWSYTDLVAAARDQATPSFPLARTVVPSWDNDARRPGRGLTITGSTPDLYQEWLEEAIDFAIRNPIATEPLVFINAWNEWTEGAYLEPDAHFGAAYLNATSRALQARSYHRGRRRVLLVGHDAATHGSQRLLLDIGRTLSRRFGIDVEFLMLSGGDLIDRYREVGPVHIVAADDPRLSGHVAGLVGRGYRHAITNTVVSGAVIPLLREHGFTVVSLVHEMESFIEDRGWVEPARVVASAANKVVFAAQLVADRFRLVAPVEDERVVVMPQGLYLDALPVDEQPAARAAMRNKLGLGPGTRLVLGVGYADLRKGFDLFAQAAATALQSAADLKFIWVGGGDPHLLLWALESQPQNLSLVEQTEDVIDYYAAADVLFLSSREDAFPSTVMEAMSYGLPVVGFEGCTGTGDLIARFGRTVPPFDLAAAVAALSAVAGEQDPDTAGQRRKVVAEEFEFADYAFRLVQELFPGTPRIAVAVPSYNYAHYLDERMATIFGQTHPVFEVLVLEDASEDDTMEVLERIREESGREFTVMAREKNAGSIWRQWRDGAAMTRSEYLWIAEADDTARLDFLDRVSAALIEAGAETAFAYCDSAQIDATGVQTSDSYRPYLNEHFGSQFSVDFRMTGSEFRSRFLTVRNSILNTSSAVFRRTKLLEALDRNSEDLARLRFAGDWVIYADLCSHGDIAFVAAALNVHRRHRGTTLGTPALEHVAEIARAHEALNRKFGASDELVAEQQRYRDSVLEYLS